MTAPAQPAPDRTGAMMKGRQADSARRRQRVLAAIGKASADGTEISVSAIARAAAVDRTFLYRHRDLLEKIHAIEAGPPPGTAAPGHLSPGHPCRRTCSRPTSVPSGWTPASGNWRRGCRRRSASRPGASPGSRHPPTSTPLTRRSARWSSRSSTFASSSKNRATT